MQRFFKYQGAGNDFIVFDNRSGFFDASNHLMIRRLCDRRFGIGADGLMLLQAHGDYDFEMRYFNADGHEGSLCGNGGRCMVAFAHSLGLFGDQTVFLAADGEHTAYLAAGNPGTTGAGGYTVKLRMNDVSSVLKDGDAWVLDTGSPHFVQEVRDLRQFPLMEEAKKSVTGHVMAKKALT